MPPSFEISQEAENDLLEAYRWYEEQQIGLGEDFLTELDKGIVSILQAPTAYQIRYKRKVRAFLIQRFPFLVMYIVNKKHIQVISVFHTSRNPKVWKKRAK